MNITNVVVETTPNQVANMDTAIPQMYKDLGVVAGYDPVPAEDARIYVVGFPGQGKSTWASSTPNTLVLDLERGANALPGSKAARIPLRGDYEKYVKVTNQLIEDGKVGRRPFKRIVWDTIDELVEMVSDQLAREKEVDDIMEFGSKGHGVQLIRTRVWSTIRALEAVGYTWTIVGHLTEKNVTNPVNRREEVVPRPLLFDTLAKKIQRNADLFVSVYNTQEATQTKTKRRVETSPGVFKEIEVEGEMQYKPVYYLYTQSSGTIEAKRRGVPTLKQRLEMPMIGGWNVFAEAYAAAVTTEKQKYIKA
jgi:hypothetical protein